jgi:hypothetical protein
MEVKSSTAPPIKKVTTSTNPTLIVDTSDEVFFSPITPRKDKNKVVLDYKDAVEIRGTGPRSENINLASPKVWMYLYGLDPSTDESDVDDFVKSSFNCDRIRTIKLLPQHKNPNSCEFVSFKIGFPVEMKEKALDPNSWPEDVKVREFIDQQKKASFRQRLRSQSTNRGNNNYSNRNNGNHGSSNNRRNSKRHNDGITNGRRNSNRYSYRNKGNNHRTSSRANNFNNGHLSYDDNNNFNSNYNNNNGLHNSMRSGNNNGDNNRHNSSSNNYVTSNNNGNKNRYNSSSSHNNGMGNNRKMNNSHSVNSNRRNSYRQRTVYY